MPLFNTFSNSLDDLVNSSDEEDVISHRRYKNAMSPQLPAIRRDRVASHSELEEGIMGAKRDTSDVSFLYRGIIKCN